MKAQVIEENARNYVYFWNGPFSQWFGATFTVQGTVYNCAEQYMMHQKALMFGDYEIAKMIMETGFDPREQKKLGRKVRGFQKSVWDARAKFIVKKGNEAKFTQNPDLLQELMATGDKTIVEASPVDEIWGIKLDTYHALRTPVAEWPGTNWLGEVLTELRDELKHTQV